MLNKFEKDKLEMLKERSKPADASPLIKFALDKNVSSEERREMVEAIKRGSEKAGCELLERAFIEKVITEKEWKNWQKKYGFEPGDISVVLQAYFKKKDGLLREEKVIVLSMEYSKIYKNKDFLKKKFGVKIIEPKEGIKIFKKLAKKKNEII